MSRLTLGAAAAVVAAAAACSVDEGAPAQEGLHPGAPSGHVDLGPPPGTTGPDGGAAAADDGDAAPRAQPRADRFATRVVSFTPGPCSGFGAGSMPDVVLGPPRGEGSTQGSLDVVSFGKGGEIVLSFEPNAVIDGPGVDLIVFENAFYPAGDAEHPYAEPAEVSVSDDGVSWVTFPCTAAAPPYGACAGWHPVHATTAAAAIDPARAGGDPYDLGEIGVTRARFVRIKDRTAQRCTSQGPNNNGFDLDAIAAVNAEDP
jgi:hypothetical protein